MNLEAYKKYFKPSEECHKGKTNPQICKGCGGDCCKSMGCHIAPDDLMSLNVGDIISFIDESGCISVDWWEGNPVTNERDGKKYCFLRIKNKNENVIAPSWGGECSILTDTGCSLSFEYRPKGARELIPDLDNCHQNYTKQQCAIDWMQYSDVMEQVYNHYIEIEGEPNVIDDALDNLLGLIGLK